MYYIYNQQLEFLTDIQADEIFNGGNFLTLMKENKTIMYIPNNLIVSSIPLSKPTTVEKSPEEVKALNILKEKCNEGSYAPISELADKGYQGEIKVESYIHYLLQFVDREKDKLVYFTADNIDDAKYSTHYYYEGKLIHMSKPGEEVDIISTHIKFSQPVIAKVLGHTSSYTIDLIEVTKHMVVLYLDGEKIIPTSRKDFELLEPKINFKF